MPTDDRDGRVDDAIAEFLAACDAGAPPDRALFLDRHRDIASSLAAFLVDHDRMRKAVPTDTVGLAAAPEAALGTVRYFGDYELLEEIARGGMGVVFKARQVSLNRVVAMKMILAGQLAGSTEVARFRAEAEAAANLDHPNILPIHEVGEHQGQQYFSMKLVEGGSLADRAPALAGRPREIAALLTTLARAVHHAHQRGVLHRDLKPANILIDADGTPYVTDFGLAKRVDSDSGQTRTGAIVGTPSYMAPEQARGEKGLAVSVDVYSLGAILFELLAGRPPFRGETAYETIRQVIEGDTPTPPGDRDLAAVALKCLAKDPAARYASAAELADDLDRWRAGEPTRARPPSAAGVVLRWLQRNAAAAATVVALGVVWGASTGMLLYVGDSAEHASYRKIRLLADADGWFNPMGWATRGREVLAVRWGVFATAAVLWLSAGWWLRAGARPRTSAAALGAAAATGLLAAWVCNLFVAPAMAVESRAQLYPLRSEEPPTWRFDPNGKNFRLTYPDIDMIHFDLKYLEQYIPPEKRDPTSMANATEYTRAHDDLMAANRYHRAAVGVWASQFVTLVLLLSAAVAGGWAADYLPRSGRGRVAQVLCYLELYLPVLATFVSAVAFVALLRVHAEIEQHRGAPPLWPAGVFLAGTLTVVAVAWIGIHRRWPPTARGGAYLAWVVGNVVLLWAAGGFR